VPRPAFSSVSHREADAMTRNAPERFKAPYGVAFASVIDYVQAFLRGLASLNGRFHIAA
jgi:hypothetical protein